MSMFGLPVIHSFGERCPSLVTFRGLVIMTWC